MAVTIQPAGLAAAPVANALAFTAAYREKLCRPFCVDSTLQPQVSVVYTTGTPRLNGTTVFVPIRATITMVTQGGRCGCNAHTQLFTEDFVVDFQGQTALPTAVALTQAGRDQFGANVDCGCAHSYVINDSLLLTITPPAAASETARSSGK